jgi:hypothetical protein
MAEVLYPAKLSTIKDAALRTYLKRRVLGLKADMKELFEEKVVKYRAAYDAKPAQESRSFPWDGASNLVIPIIAIHTDTLKAQIMAAIFKTEPIVVAKVLGDYAKEVDELKGAYEEFMQYVCIEPAELDLYRVYGEGVPETIKYGTTTYKIPWENRTRDFLIPGGNDTVSKRDFLVKTIYEGPRPEKLPFTGFYIPPSAKTLEDAEIKCHKRVMLQHELEERKFTGLYDKEVVDSILASPDRTSPTTEVREKDEAAGIHTTASFGYKEWDIWECYLQWRYADDAYAPRMVVTYHEKTDKILRAMYDNSDTEWFVGMRMAHRDDSYHGIGFAEALFPFQEGGSETYNGYRDNQTVANTRVWRVDEDSKILQGYRIYPSAMLPGKKDEIEALAHGDVSTINLDELRLLLELAERRSGVSPPQQGMGAGTFGKKGIYSSMGTLSVMQEGNSRKDLNVSDMRDGHVRMMRIISKQYGVLGPDSKYHRERLELFGAKAEKIAAALQLIVTKKIGLPCYSSTASLNKEVEKQNDVMLSQMMTRHYMMIAQLLGSMQNVMTPPQVKEYFAQVIVASNFLMKTLLRNFGHSEVDRLIPDPFKQGATDQGASNVNGGAAQQGAQQNSDMAGGPGGERIQ